MLLQKWHFQLTQIKITATPPAVRKKKTEEGVTELHGDNDRVLLSSWGVEITPKMVEVNARCLAPPKISFQKTSLTPQAGSWRIDSGHLFTSPSVLSNWSIAVFGDERDMNIRTIQNFMQMFGRILTEKGISIYIPSNIEDLVVYQRSRGDIEGTLVQAKNVALDIGKRAAEKGFKRTNGREVDVILCIMMVTLI